MEQDRAARFQRCSRRGGQEGLLELWNRYYSATSRFLVVLSVCWDVDVAVVSSDFKDKKNISVKACVLNCCLCLTSCQAAAKWNWANENWRDGPRWWEIVTAAAVTVDLPCGFVLSVHSCAATKSAAVTLLILSVSVMELSVSKSENHSSLTFFMLFLLDTLC